MKNRIYFMGPATLPQCCTGMLYRTVHREPLPPVSHLMTKVQPLLFHSVPTPLSPVSHLMTKVQPLLLHEDLESLHGSVVGVQQQLRQGRDL